MVLLHGAGLSSMAWACCARELRHMGHMVCAVDMRGHGATRTQQDGLMSTEQLVQDARNVLLHLYGRHAGRYSLFLVGHSLGGAIAAHIATATTSVAASVASAAASATFNTKTSSSSSSPWTTATTSGSGNGNDTVGRLNIVALCTVDVVEGTALASLQHMKQLLCRRPAAFASLEAAIRWSVESGQCRDVGRARVSVPSQLVQLEHDGRYVWRVDLHRTERFWREWYQGLSDVFLSFGGAKLILLANTDRLDKPLTIAQMQGKFVMQVLRSVGHFLIEDDPPATADALVRFAQYFRLA